MSHEHWKIRMYGTDVWQIIAATPDVPVYLSLGLFIGHSMYIYGNRPKHVLFKERLEVFASVECG